MRKFFKRLGWGLLLFLVVLAAVGLWKREQLMRLMAVNSLFSEDRIVHNFSHMDQLFLSAPMDGGTPSALPLGDDAPMPDGFDTWLAERSVTGLVVLHDGQIVHEQYRLGTAQDDPRISWSVAKSALSLLLGTLVADGTIPDLDAPVTQYAPALRGSAYDGATIRNVLRMSSGVAFNEDYLDFWSDINRMGRVLALGGSMDGFAAGQTARRPAAPGSDWHYVSIDTHVIGMVIRGATGRSIPDLLSERIFQPLGLDRDPYYVTDGEGVAFVLGGLNLTTRDYARIGQMVLQEGAWQGQQIVPADWIAESTAPGPHQAEFGTGYGYQWWLPPDARPGEAWARGVYGQNIWIDRTRGVVIAVNSADRLFEEPPVMPQNVAMFRAIAETVSPPTN
ncbi:serine hydrolase [Pararhodobacter sp. CCB-MM2]|uniref:serine hydrolase domain-containing protein n=1 Tax=Pararhodobacter sp. CCB-MM2 TaxID=1786003 RepID=UPI0008349F12|nr:serine hydrolase [Pararhodobacter sp. CCB-MM2]